MTLKWNDKLEPSFPFRQTVPSVTGGPLRPQQNSLTHPPGDRALKARQLVLPLGYGIVWVFFFMTKNMISEACFGVVQMVFECGAPNHKLSLTSPSQALNPHLLTFKM